jgi:hypothetical protein
VKYFVISYFNNFFINFNITYPKILLTIKLALMSLVNLTSRSQAKVFGSELITKPARLGSAPSSARLQPYIHLVVPKLKKKIKESG